jgi:hypothetical protein
VRCPEWLINTPAEKLQAEDFAKIENVEIRREFVRKIGIERLIQKLGAKVIDKQGTYELLEMDLNLSAPARALKMKNPSIDVWHVEFVPPEIDSVQKAINWRAQEVLTEGDWQPGQLT